MLLHINSIQQAVANALVESLSSRLHTKVTIGEVHYKFFNVMSVEDLYVEDQQRDTLLYVGDVDAEFKFWKFFSGKVIFTSVDIDRLYGNLKVDKSGRSNLDFVIEAFKKKSANDTATVEFRLEQFHLRRSAFRYHNFQHYKSSPKGVFNGNDLFFKGVSANIALSLLLKDSISASISSLTATDKSGLCITNLQTRVYGMKKGIHMPELLVEMPNSKILLEDVSLKYDSLADLKHMVQKVKLQAPLSLSHIALSDLGSFLPQLRNAKGEAWVKGKITGRISNLHLQKIQVKYEKSLWLSLDADINGLPNFSELFVYAQLNELNANPVGLQDLISQLTGRPFVLPRELSRLGMLKYKGNITGFLSDLVAYGNLNTNVGSISTDISIKLQKELKDIVFSGKVRSTGIKLGRLLKDPKLGDLSFNLITSGHKKMGSALKGTIAAKIPLVKLNDYTYRDISFDGKFDGKGFNGNAAVDDENIHARFDGLVDLTKKLPVFDFGLKVQNTNLNALHLTTKYPGALLSFNGNTKMIGNSLDNINGYISFDSIVFTNQGRTLNVDNVSLVSRTDDKQTLVTVTSDYVNGSIGGDFKYSNIGNTIGRIVQNYLPSLSVKEAAKTGKMNHVDVDLTVANTKDVSTVMQFPYILGGVSTIKGYIDEATNHIEIAANVPSLRSEKETVENITLHIENVKKQLKMSTHALLHTKEDVMSLFVNASAQNDTLSGHIGWQNSKKITNAGEIKLLTAFRKESGRTAVHLSLLPTQVIIADSIWNIHRSNIDFKPDSSIHVDEFLFDSNKQFVRIGGVASKNANDSMLVTMNDIQLQFLMNGLLGIHTVEFGGGITGKAKLFNVLSQPVYEANVLVKNMSINKSPIGDGMLHSTWDRLNNQVLAGGVFVNGKNQVVATADGVYVPKNDSVNFLFDANKLNVGFLRRYFDGVVDDFRGLASGKIRMLGPTKILGFEGSAFVSEGQGSVNVLRTTYFFEDSVHLTRKSITLKNIKLYDQERNRGNLTGVITHDGSFRDMKYNVNIVGKNMMALNTGPEDNDYFFGKAYVDGNVHIFGSEQEQVCNIWVNGLSRPNTKCFVNMGGASTATDNNSFIQYVNKRISVPKEAAVVHKPGGTNVKVNLQIDVNPDAAMELIVDPKGGDLITGRGSGSLQVEFDTYSDIKLYGTYIIDNGNYLFTLQNLIRKEFKINKGSTIAWTGNPYSAKVNIQALYPLSASLKDLDQNLLTQNRTTVPVNCVLKLTDDLMKPTIKFDIDLPQSDETVKQRVQNIVSTDEMMNRQILYLLVFGKFYTPEYMQTSTVNSLVPNEAISFGLSTLSAQVNSWISRASNNLTLGLDFKPSDKVTNEYQLQTQLLYQPNSRLVINGNFGYTTENANASTNNNKFIGDVDVEYMLTEAGKLRLKAYNHTVDRYRLTTAKTTQGVGFLYKEDFSTVGDMLSYYWKLITNIGKKKVKGDGKVAQ